MVTSGSKSGAPASSPTRRGRRNSSELRLRRWEELTLLENGKLVRLLERLQRRFAKLSLPQGVLEAKGEAFLAAVDYYCKNAFHERPADFFKPPQEVPRISIHGSRPIGDGEAATIRFQSGFEPNYPAYRATFEQMPHNRLVQTRAWRHPVGRSKGTIIAIHGWQMEDQGVSAVALSCGFLFRLGMNVLLYELPYHGSRRLAGEGTFPSLNPARTNEGFAQAIYELRQLRLLLESMGEERVSVVGLSLGGYTAALWAALDKLSAAVFVSPLSDIVRFAEDFLLQGAVPEALPGLGVVRNRIFEPESTALLCEAFRVHSPLSYPSKQEQGRVALLAAENDEMVPHEHPEALCRHWGLSGITWLPGGHFGQLYTAEARAALQDFFVAADLAFPEALPVPASQNLPR